MCHNWGPGQSEQSVHSEINSERGLQIHFCMALQKQFEQDNVSRRLFIEPSVRFESKNVIPDILIANSQRIIGVVELKYLPRIAPKREKDFNTLAMFGKFSNSTGITITNERYRGPQKPKLFTIAPDCVLCWASIHAGKSINTVTSLPLEEYRSRYLGLYAETTVDKPPTIGVDDGLERQPSA